MRVPVLIRALIVIMAAAVWAPLPGYATIQQHGPSPEVAAENNPTLVNLFWIRIENRRDGPISVFTSMKFMEASRVIGKVLLPTSQISEDSFTASMWAPDGHVAATAVNAIHIKVGTNARSSRGMTFSLVPTEYDENGESKYQRVLRPSASIYTNIPAGQQIFGGLWSPFVRNPVFIEREGDITPIPEDYVPKIGDIFLIAVRRPAKYPRSIVFENRFGGAITIIYADRSQKIIGEVLKPVVGVGRFSGSQFSDIGRLRANHPGVIDIDTSPIGDIGGFQILPANHGMSPEMLFARTLTQWMVVGPVSGLAPSFEGVAPLFAYYLRPVYIPVDENTEKLFDTLNKRLIVDVKMTGSTAWQPMPEYSLTEYLKAAELPKWAYSALKDVTHVRILFPITP